MGIHSIDVCSLHSIQVLVPRLLRVVLERPEKRQQRRHRDDEGGAHRDDRRDDGGGEAPQPLVQRDGQGEDGGSGQERECRLSGVASTHHGMRGPLELPQETSEGGSGV